MRLSRRHFLLGAAAALPAGRAAADEAAGAKGAAAGRPPVRLVTLRAGPATLALPGAAPRPILSFDGTPGGPVLRVPAGTPLDVQLANGTPTPFALQWHGLRLPAAEGGDWPPAAQPIPPGATRTLRITPRDSGLAWFHPAPVPGGGDLTTEGLRGLLVVEETAPPAVDAEVVLALAEWPAPDGKAAALLAVNGAAPPAEATLPPGGRLRLRVVNATLTRPMILALEGARPLIVAIDGQPSDLFEPVHDAVPVGPGARFEFMVDLPAEPERTFRLSLKGDDAGTVLFTARTAGQPRAVALPPVAPLPPNPALPPAIPLERSARADLRIERAAPPPAPWLLNGVASPVLAAAPLLKVARGRSVTLGFDNRSTSIVPLRVHGHVMRLLHPRDDGWEPYWRDSVILLPGTVTHVAFVADNPGRWLIDSALFAQAAAGLRTWFEVT